MREMWQSEQADMADTTADIQAFTTHTSRTEQPVNSLYPESNSFGWNRTSFHPKFHQHPVCPSVCSWSVEIPGQVITYLCDLLWFHASASAEVSWRFFTALLSAAKAAAHMFASYATAAAVVISGYDFSSVPSKCALQPPKPLKSLCT